jgi:GNAT superfamily N-acetyltransferase
MISASTPAASHLFDRWLKTRALSNQERTLPRFLSSAMTIVIGYYGLAPTAIVPSTLPRSIRTGQPPGPVPCLLLGQLATDLNWVGKGVGTGLLKHALQRCVTAAGLIGRRALIVNAVARSCGVLETTRLHCLKRRSARSVQVDHRYWGVASLSASQPQFMKPRTLLGLPSFRERLFAQFGTTG